MNDSNFFHSGKQNIKKKNDKFLQESAWIVFLAAKCVKCWANANKKTPNYQTPLKESARRGHNIVNMYFLVCLNLFRFMPDNWICEWEWEWNSENIWKVKFLWEKLARDGNKQKVEFKNYNSIFSFLTIKLFLSYSPPSLPPKEKKCYKPYIFSSQIFKLNSPLSLKTPITQFKWLVASFYFH